MWNSVGYNSTHKEAAALINLCGRNGFRLDSPRHTPTFYLAKGKGTAIDLIWANHRALDKIAGVHVSEENFGSDHQALKGSLAIRGFI